jgi:hypothetical protein
VVLWRIFFVLLVNALLSVLGSALLRAIAAYVSVGADRGGLDVIAGAVLAGTCGVLCGGSLRDIHQSSVQVRAGGQPGLCARGADASGGVAQLKEIPGSTVLSAWPMTDELTRPELGYEGAFRG